ncbi:hypothetical protein MUU72_05210 [Streptomyces sp. RS10V-4]|uniref:hypothetical protein n=1 Tax=Streptomyces rhizoryzae TaxID=2932493 RepID=UPI0020067B9E|nr:hypothetical protein [Streptomyces rhizoryzae]MCK7622512.1 hypothetical protein [Streptomyces rhizoryzae]
MNAARRLRRALTRIGVKVEVQADLTGRAPGVRIDTIPRHDAMRLLHTLSNANCEAVCDYSYFGTERELEALIYALDSTIRGSIRGAPSFAPQLPCRNCRTRAGLYVNRRVPPPLAEKLAALIEKAAKSPQPPPPCGWRSAGPTHHPQDC